MVKFNKIGFTSILNKRIVLRISFLCKNKKPTQNSIVTRPHCHTSQKSEALEASLFP